MQLSFKHNDRYIAIFGDPNGASSSLRDSWEKLGGQYVEEKSCWVLPYSAESLPIVESLCAQWESTEDEENESLAAQPEQKSITVRDILDRVSGVVETAFPEPVWVTGEIQNFSKRRGSCYFALAEQGRSDGSTLTIQATLWPRVWKYLEAKHGSEILESLFQDGLSVRFLCQVSLYKVRGQVSLSVVDIDSAWTQGALALAREQLLKDLRKRGLDRMNKSRPMPAFPLHVGLVTASGSRAESDFLHQLMDSGFPGQVSFVSCPMQGESVDKHLPPAVRRLQHCDVIVITRGGGSAADLRWFDTKAVAEAIAMSSIPVIAAIGHHDDRSVAEDIAYLRVKTPTAAAESVVQSFRDVSGKLQSYVQHFSKMLTWRAQMMEAKLVQLEQAVKSAADHQLHWRRHRLDQAGQLMSSLVQQRLGEQDYRIQDLARRLSDNARSVGGHFEQQLQQQHMKLESALHAVWTECERRHLEYEKRLVQHDPKPWLEQGWTRLYQNQNIIRTIDDVIEGPIAVRLLDGRLQLQVLDKEKV